jgi:hypothetical protein
LGPPPPTVETIEGSSSTTIEDIATSSTLTSTSTTTDSVGSTMMSNVANVTVIEPALPEGDNALGAIIGGAIGGLIFLLLLAALIWWLVRRRQKPSEADSNGATPLDSSSLRRSHNYGAFPSSPNEYGAAPPETVVHYDAALPGGHYGAAPSLSPVDYDLPESALQ